MLDAALTAQLTSHFEKITRPIELAASLDDSPKSRELHALLDRARLALRPHHGRAVRRRRPPPSFAIRRVGTDVDVRFAGIPLGHEFTSLVLALLQVGGHPSTASPELVQQVEDLEGDFAFETYFSLTCQNCPDVVQALNLMSVAQPADHPRRHRRRAVPGRGRGPPGHGRAGGVPQRRAVRPGPHDARADRRQARHGRRRARRGGHRRQGPVRRARGGRRPGRRVGRRVRGPQGHPHRRGRRAVRRPGARHDGHRELHLGPVHRGPRSSPPRSNST